MSKKTRLILHMIILLLLLAACNQPQEEPTQPPMDIEVTQDIVEDTEVPLQPTDTEVPPTEEDPTPQPPPTSAPQEIILEGERVPLLAAGSIIDIQKIQMLESHFGWAISADADGIHHLLITNNWAKTWMDISPPQPLDPASNWLTINAHFEDRDHGWAAYNNSDLVWTTVDGGITWQPFRLEYETRLGAMIHSYDEDHVWLFQYLDAGMQKVYFALYQSTDGGASWTKLRDPMTGDDYSIQGFDKTGVHFKNPDFGWLTRNFRGVSPDIRIDFTRDGGATWEGLELPAPPSAPDAFENCACGLSDPTVYGNSNGIVKLECSCFEGGGSYTKNYLYQTEDGGESWAIEYIPEGELHYMIQGNIFIINREIYQKCELCQDFTVVNTVNWDGQFSFLDWMTAIGVAYNPDTEQYALVSTDDGCRSFSIINTEVIASNSIR